MKIIADTHTHTIASGHAHSTVIENAEAARALGLKFLAVTDHASSMIAAPKEIYFDTLPNVLAHSWKGVYLLSGCEANIVNGNGTLDLSDRILKKLDLIIASMHSLCMQPINKAAHTSAWLHICDNPNVDVLGHTGDERYAFDYEKVIKRCSETGKVIEINAHSFDARPGSDKNCRVIARLCMQYGVPVLVSSDSHFATTIGDFEPAIMMLEEIGFPEELILNASYDNLSAWLELKTGRKFPPLED